MARVQPYVNDAALRPVADNPVSLDLGQDALKGQATAIALTGQANQDAFRESAQAGKETATLGREVMKAAETVQDTLDKYKAITELSDAHITAATELAQAQGALSVDQDYANHLPKFREKSAEIKERVLGKITSPMARQNFEAGWGSLYAPHEIAVGSQSRKVAIHQFHATVLEKQDVYEASIAGVIKDIVAGPNSSGMSGEQMFEQAQAYIAQLTEKNRQNFGGSAAAGIFDADTAYKATQKFNENANYALGRALVLYNPMLARKKLADGGLKISDPLKATQLMTQIDAGITHQLTQEQMRIDRANREEDKAIKQQGEAVEKGLLLLTGSGKPGDMEKAGEFIRGNLTSRVLPPSAVAHYTLLTTAERSRNVEHGAESLRTQFSPKNFETIINPTDPTLSARIQAHVTSTYHEMVGKGVDPKEAEHQAAKWGNEVNVAGLPIPPGSGLAEADRWNPARIESRIGELDAEYEGLSVEGKKVQGAWYAERLMGLNRLKVAHQKARVEIPLRESKDIDQLEALSKAEQDATNIAAENKKRREAIIEKRRKAAAGEAPEPTTKGRR